MTKTEQSSAMSSHPHLLLVSIESAPARVKFEHWTHNHHWLFPPQASSYLWCDALNGGGIAVVRDESFHLIADGHPVHFRLVVHTDPPGFSGIVSDRDMPSSNV